MKAAHRARQGEQKTESKPQLQFQAEALLAGRALPRLLFAEEFEAEALLARRALPRLLFAEEFEAEALHGKRAVAAAAHGMRKIKARS